MVRLHATCINLNGSGILLRGPSGSGKSDLGLRLIDGGGVLVADDYCEVHVAQDRLIANPPAAIAGLLEMRGFGIVRLPYTRDCAVGMVIDLCPSDRIPRLPDQLTVTIEGIAIAWMQLDPLTASAAAKVRAAAHAVVSRTREATDTPTL